MGMGMDMNIEEPEVRDYRYQLFHRWGLPCKHHLQRACHSGQPILKSFIIHGTGYKARLFSIQIGSHDTQISVTRSR
jgi:hypothetical protein